MRSTFRHRDKMINCSSSTIKTVSANIAIQGHWGELFDVSCASCAFPHIRRSFNRAAQTPASFQSKPRPSNSHFFLSFNSTGFASSLSLTRWLVTFSAKSQFLNYIPFTFHAPKLFRNAQNVKLTGVWRSLRH